MTPPAVPLAESQVASANALHTLLAAWATTDRALTALRECFPGFDYRACLLKSAAVNQLYGTNVYALARMAEHVATVLDGVDTTTGGDMLADALLVERLAALPKTPTQSRAWRHFSFASKFAHFFIDRERFPIYDSYAEGMVAYHLGRKEREKDPEHPYQAFIRNLHALRQRAGITCSAVELDRYLWLAGLYRAWRHNAKSQINVEVARLFELPSPAAAEHLAALLPTDFIFMASANTFGTTDVIGD